MFRFLVAPTLTAVVALLVSLLMPLALAVPAGPARQATTPDCTTIPLVGMCVLNATAATTTTTTSNSSSAGNSTRTGFCLSSPACPATLGEMQSTSALAPGRLGRLVGAVIAGWIATDAVCLGFPQKLCTNLGFVCINSVSCNLTGPAILGKELIRSKVVCCT